MRNSLLCAGLSTTAGLPGLHTAERPQSDPAHSHMGLCADGKHQSGAASCTHQHQLHLGGWGVQQLQRDVWRRHTAAGGLVPGQLRQRGRAQHVFTASACKQQVRGQCGGGAMCPQQQVARHKRQCAELGLGQIQQASI